jgi:hypothetical protein
MIELFYDGDVPSIRFSPWATGDITKEDKEYKKVGHAPTLTRQLIYGHFCTECQNLIQAAFLTDTAIDPKDYEELNTTIMDTHGQRKVIRTGVNSRFKSKYDINTIQRGSLISAELIRLKEHFDRHPYEPTWCSFCHYTAYFSFRYDIALQQILIDSGTNPNWFDLSQKNIPEILAALKDKGHSRESYVKLKDFAGRVPDVILVERGVYSRRISSLLKSFYKADHTEPTVAF